MRDDTFFKQFASSSPEKKPVFIIAEIGTAHGGDIHKAKEMIHAAAEAGADCTKFQMVFADEIIHRETGSVPLPGGDTPLFDVFRKLERPLFFYRELKEETEKQGLTFLCTPFGIKSARLLRDLGVSHLKIASPELNHLPLLEEIAGYGLPLFVSSGVSTLGDIEEALNILKARRAAEGITLLHCVTSYPAPEEEYNLRVIRTLSAVLGIPLGVSDHSLDPELVPVLSTILGSAALEKHICLARGDGGLDDPIALEPGSFRRMCRAVREAEKMETGETLRALLETYGEDKIGAVIGDGIKRLAPSERENYGRTNRSIHALEDLSPGTLLSAENTAILRTEKLLGPGLHPRWYSKVLGKRVLRHIPAGEGILWEDLLS